MSVANDPVLSKAVHKALVEVNEEAKEAAAAAIMVMGCARITPTFVVDHTFLFFIRSNPGKSILFSGRYTSPE